MELPPRYCPRCGEEYVHTATRCAECDVDLTLDPSHSGQGESEAVASSTELAAVRNADLRWITALVERLSAAGIPSHVELPESDPGSRGPATRGTLFVRPEDATRAGEIDAAVAREQIPDIPADASHEWVESDTCPGCTTAIPPDAPECPDCGLVLTPPEAS